MTNYYQSLYDLIQTYVFGNTPLGSNAELCTMLLASIGSILLVALPFLLVWKVVKSL